MENQDFLLETLKDLKHGQTELRQKTDNLHQYIMDHMTEESVNFAVIRERLIILEERGRVRGKKWGFIATVATSVVTAILVMYIKIFYGEV